MSETILVSGANGFLATHTIAGLLADGYRVIGTVRDPNNSSKTAHLTSLPNAAKRLTLVAADLTDDNPFGAYLDGVDAVLHMASPYSVNVDDPRRDLLEPALRGTLSMLEAVDKCPTVRRVVLTSSVAAITDEPNQSKLLSEQDWNTKSSLTRNPYFYSKTRAEEAAWDFVEDDKRHFDLVVINPFMVIGPSRDKSVNTSNQILVDMIAGAYPAIMDLTFGMVDVRDVADAHIKALTSKAANGRYICAAETIQMRPLVAELRGRLGEGTNLPTRSMDTPFGSVLIKLMSYTQPKGTGSYLRSHVGRGLRFDNGKIQRDLGVSFRPLEETIADTLQDLQRWGHI